MPLDPAVRDYLDKMASLKIPNFDELPPAEGRALFRTLRGLVGRPDPVGSIEDRTLGGTVPIPVRVYQPLGPRADEARPGLVFFHGGGWVVGGIETVDGLCRKLSNGSGAVVVSVDYRLAPEHKFPEPLQDCFEAVQIVARDAPSFGIDPTRIAVGGDSAGGNLASAVALMARDQGGPALAYQLLIYPITDHRCQSASYATNAEGYGLSAGTMAWYWDQYLARPEDGASPLASPLLATDLAGLPPALVVTAEFDVLRDEGDAFAARLSDAGVTVEHHCYRGQIHGFIQFGAAFEATRAAVIAVNRSLRDNLAISA